MIEKMIKELKEHCDELELINQKVMEENEQLKLQFEKIMCCGSCKHRKTVVETCEKKKPLLENGTKIKFDNGKLYNIEKRVDLYNREEYYLRDKNTMVRYPMDYLIGKIWEVEE